VKSLLYQDVHTPTPEEDRSLLASAQAGSVDSRNELIRRHIPFILNYCRKQRRCAYMTRDDMAHECVLATMRAIDKYDAAKANGRFMAYARQWMRDWLAKARNCYALWNVPLSTRFLYDSGQLNTSGKEKTRRAIESFRPLERWDGKYEPVGRELGPVECAIINELSERHN
jgi:hypothetical protein